MDVRFVIVSPASRKAAHAVRLPVLVGRGDEAKFRVQQDSVSRRHCEFFPKDDAVFVRDLGSTNGTLVAGERIASSAAMLVPPGTEVRVGGIVFRVDYESAAAPAATEPRGDDTVPMAAADDTLETLEPAAEPESAAEPDRDAEFESGAELDVPDATADAEIPDLASLAAAGEPATESAGFDFLGGEAAAPQSDGDDKLDDFFKSLT
jgi:pSer/pThr/pTyr-binding forkhead associated (FHA) protein